VEVVELILQVGQSKFFDQLFVVEGDGVLPCFLFREQIEAEDVRVVFL
jgi:hypothetical protein